MVSTIFGWCLLLVNLPRIHTEVNHTWDHSQKQFFMQSRVCGSGQLSYLPNKSDIPGKKKCFGAKWLWLVGIRQTQKHWNNVSNRNLVLIHFRNDKCASNKQKDDVKHNKAVKGIGWYKNLWACFSISLQQYRSVWTGLLYTHFMFTPGLNKKTPCYCV